jgi:hypothetical protein
VAADHFSRFKRAEQSNHFRKSANHFRNDAFLDRMSSHYVYHVIQTADVDNPCAVPNFGFDKTNQTGHPGWKIIKDNSADLDGSAILSETTQNSLSKKASYCSAPQLVF